MDSGILDVAWCQGYNGSKLSVIETGVIAYQCGRNVKTVSLSGKYGAFAFKDAAIGPVAFHKVNKHIAIAEYTQKPKIFIYEYPSFSELTVLTEGADLEFQTIAFSESDYLASISGVPNFKLILWNYVDNIQLSTVAITKDAVKSLSFNKTNWRQICMMTDSVITLWSVEQCNTKFLIRSHVIRLPPANLNEHMDEYVVSFDNQTEKKPSKKNNKYVMDIPDSAIAGLSGEEVEYFDVVKDSTLRVRPVSITWLPTGDFYVGCEDGELFKVDTDLMKIYVLYCPSSNVEENSEDQSNSSHLGSVTLDELQVVDLKPGSLQCMDFHQNGLYIAGKDGFIRLLDVTSEKIILKEEIYVNFPVTSIAFSPNYQILAWGSPEGIIQYYTCGNVNSVTTLLDVHHGKFVGVGGLPLGTDCAVSLREDGLLQLWKLADGTYVSELNIGEVCEALVCSRLAQYAVVGTRSGSLCFIDLTNTQKPRLIVKQRLFRQPLKHLVFNGDAGTLLFVASDVNSIFVIDARATAGFSVLGYLTVSGKTQCMATYVNNHNTILLVACNNNPQISGANLLYKYTFSDDMIKDIHLHYKSSMCDIKEESCRALKMGLRHAICSLAFSDLDFFYAISANTKRLISFPLPDQDKKLRKVDLLLSATGDHPGLQLPGGHVLMSPHCKWLLTYGADGYIKIRTCTQLDKTAAFATFEYRDGGVRSVAFSDDHVYILCIGYDGTISCCHWNRFKGKSGGFGLKHKRDRDTDFANRENARLTAFQDYMQSYGSHRKASEIEHERKVGVEFNKQAAQDRDEIYISPPPTPSVNATWLEQHEIDLLRQEGQHFASIKYELRSQIRDIRKTIQNMMIQNNDLPDIEKLSRNEFDLDLEEQNRLQAEGEAEIHKVREDIEYENLSKLYIREKIKEQCWDKMNVKGRAIQAFNSALEVTNFPLRERSGDFLRLIKTVSTRRKIEMREAEARKQIAEVVPKLSTHEDEVETEETDESSVDHLSLNGSLGALCGGANEQFYNQFDMHCREQKINQIILIEDAIHRIKEAFNKEFDEVYSKKEQEITKVKEKNKRISKIIDYLGLDEEILEPGMSVAEKPELLFEVNENEIKAEKYLTAEQRKQLEEAKRLEEERRARERGDNARERALEMMMGGVLEIKKEDELKKDVPKPAFMLTKKEEEFSEEEQKLFKEYLKKVQDLNEEREKFKKQLESELRKLQVTIQENLQAFDDTLNLLFERKIKIMMVVFQEELKILRLRYAMLIQEEIETQEKDLTHALEHKKHLKQQSAEAVAEAKKSLEICRNEYDTLQAEDKYLERSFKREFNDISAVIVDGLYKHFKKRPRASKYRNPSEPPILNKSQNPFADRPSSALQLAVQKTQMSMALDDLDKLTNAPEGLDVLVWERMCKLRRAKVESEAMLKAKANALAEVQSFLHKRHSDDDKLKAEIEQINHKLSKLKEDEQRFILNLEVQLLLKQGQIEVDCGPFIQDFRDSVLIHRSVVEDLNTTIKALGESKIASMVESKDFRKGIIQLEWEHKKMSMEMEDLESKMKDIQFIKVTREIQAFLQEEDYEAKKQAEIATLEQTITMLKKYHEKNVAKKTQTLKSIQRGAKMKEVSNEKLYAELLDLNVVVNERRHIEEVNGGCRDDGGEVRRYQEIKQRRKLVDLAKAQAQEIAILRAEVERLRMRTFPALVQVER
ncbi:hypothetical protein BsWGS_00763 [Bradybaena similaris]